MATIICSICGKERYERPSHIKRSGKKYCSMKCRNKGLKGRKLSKQHIKNMSGVRNHNFRLIGKETSRWKGCKVKYRGLHLWITKHLGKPAKCEHCGKTGLKNTKKHCVIHWANISKEYKRILSDWIRLCVKCHRNFDKSKT